MVTENSAYLLGEALNDPDPEMRQEATRFLSDRNDVVAQSILRKSGEKKKAPEPEGTEPKGGQKTTNGDIDEPGI
jgi:hypothetical protein